MSGLPQDGPSQPKPGPDRRSAILLGLLLIAIGGWFLLRNLGVPLPGVGQMWPVFVLVPGLLFLAGYVFGESHDPGLAFVGTAAVLLGGFFLMTTLGIGGLSPSDMGRLWPIYPLIGGMAFVVLWLASGMRDWGALIPGGIGLVVGLVGLGAVVMGGQVRVFNLLVNFWPVILIVVGLGLLVGYFLNRPSD